MDRTGYLKWRTDLYKFHANTTAELMAQAGYDEASIERMKQAVGKKAIKRNPDTKVIMLTSYAEEELLFEAITAGASGYVLKQIGSGELIRALETIGSGEALLDPALTQRVFDRVREASRKAEEEAFATLTNQELRILALVSKGKTNKEIADAIFLSEKTVRNYVSSIFSKLNLSTRAEAAAYAVKHRVEDYLPTD